MSNGARGEQRGTGAGIRARGWGIIVALLVGICLLALLPPVGVVHAATLSVTNCTDSDPGSLRAAIGSAATGDTITFATDCPASSPITLTSGTLTLSKDVTIDGTGRQVVIDGNCATDANSDCTGGGSTVFTIAGGSVTLRALTIQHGNVTIGGGYFYPACGGICNDGGGIYNDGGTLTVTNSTLTHNFALYGGGIFTNGGTLTVTNSTLAANTGRSRGGGIYNDGGTLTVTNSTFTNNKASEGAGIFSLSYYSTVTNCTFTNNYANTQGAGIVSNDVGMTVTNSTFTANRAGRYGGGILNEGGTLTLTNSTLTNNTALRSDGGGGGIYNYGTVTVTNSTLTNNTAIMGSGGGIYNYGTVTVTNSTLTNNTAPNGSGGGILNNGALTLTNTIVAGNTGRTGGDVSNSGAVADGGHNLVGSSTGFTFNGPGDTSGPALLTPVGSYGGTTQTFALLPGSAALGGGDATTCASTMGDAPVGGKDQRGFPRPDAGTTACDIGAFESQGFTLAKTGGDNQSVTFTGAPIPFAPLTATVTSKDSGVVVNGGTLTFAIVPGTSSATFGAAGSTGCTVSADKRTASGCTVNTSGVATSPPFTGTVIGGFTVTASATPGDAPEATYTETVTKVTTTTTVTSSVNPSSYGQSVTFTATVSVTAPGAGTPTGNVTFTEGTTPLGSNVPLTGSTASVNVSDLAAGTHTITATYSGDPNFATSSGTVSQTVNKVSTTTALTSSPNPSTFGQAVTFTATVTGPMGATTPTGTVAFTSGSTALGSGTLSGGGVATFTTSTLPVGANRTITATYSGDANFSTSNGTTSVTVNAATVASSIAILAGNNQSAPVGSPYPAPLQVKVTDRFGNPVPNAPVTFKLASLGAEASFAGRTSATVPTDANGIATAPRLTASGTAGQVRVVASTPGVANTATFTLTNAGSGGGGSCGPAAQPRPYCS